MGLKGIISHGLGSFHFSSSYIGYVLKCTITKELTSSCLLIAIYTFILFPYVGTRSFKQSGPEQVVNDCTRASPSISSPCQEFEVITYVYIYNKFSPIKTCFISSSKPLSVNHSPTFSVDHEIMFNGAVCSTISVSFAPIILVNNVDSVRSRDW